MSMFDRLSRRSSSGRAPDPEPQGPSEPPSDPEAHRLLLQYVKSVWAGEDPDPVFETKSLTHDIAFNSLHLAELIFALSEDFEIPMGRILRFVRSGIPGGGDQELANLLERIGILSEHFNSSDRLALLSSGTVGDRAEVAPILPPFDNVSFVVKFCGAIRSLKSLQDHDAPDITQVTIADDPGWPTDDAIRLATESHSPHDTSRVEKLLSILERGGEYWNAWRAENPGEYIDLREVSLFGRDLSLEGVNLAGANLSAANLAQVDLRRADLSAVYAVGAKFSGAHLENANLRGAVLQECDFNLAHLVGADLRLADLRGSNLLLVACSGANLRRARIGSADARHGSFAGSILAQADLSHALLVDTDLTEANMAASNLTGASLVGANLQGTTLDGSRVFGASVWKTDLRDTRQDDLIVTPEDEGDIISDKLQMAQLFYLSLNNEEIGEALNTLTSRTVLLLGRFTATRKRILDAVRSVLRGLGYIPMLFDFEKPRARNLTETVSTLAHLARFVIADITSPRSVPQELQAIVPNHPSLPIQPIIHSSESEWGMFADFRDYPWVLPPHPYESLDALVASLEEEVIGPAEAKVAEIARQRAER